MASKADLDRSLELTSGPVLAVARDGTIRLANARTEKLFGYDRGELSGRSIEELVPDEVREYHPELREAFFVMPHERSMGTGRELFAKCKDGTLIPVEIGLTPFESTDERLVIASILDITERRSQEEKVRLAMDAASSAMVMVDDTAKIVLANLQACRSFGYEMDELIGQPLAMLVPCELRRRHGVYVSSYMQSPGRREMATGRTVTAQCRDGSTFPAEISLTPISAHDGTFVMSTIIDITDRKRAEAESERQTADLKRLNEELAQFAYSASHDLKAPLTTVAGLIRCIQADVEAGRMSEVERNLERCERLSLQLSQRIEDALSVARSENREPQQVALDIPRVLEDLKESVAADREALGVEVSLAIPEGPMVFSTDPSRFAQIVGNLLANAIKYSDPARTKRWVRITPTLLRDGLNVVIEDNGLGIPVEYQGDVFKMFKRFHPEIGMGSGLGLSLVKKNVDTLGGHIEFESSATGTRFEVVLPNGIGSDR